jgi:transcriptional regulator with XRE-family HTH domain
MLKDLTDFLPSKPLTSGQAIRALRRNFNLTLAEVNALTKIGETNLSAIENGSKELGVKRAELLAAVFGVSPAILLFPNGADTLRRPQLTAIATRAAELRQKKLAIG